MKKILALLIGIALISAAPICNAGTYRGFIHALVDSDDNDKAHHSDQNKNNANADEDDDDDD